MLADLLVDALAHNDIWINIKGKSMSPFLKDGVAALVSRPMRVSCADILVYRYEGQIIAHRLIRRRKTRSGNILYQTKADNGYSLDEPVSLENILGKVIAVKRGDKIFRLDTVFGRFSALVLWLISLIKIIFHRKYDGMRIKG